MPPGLALPGFEPGFVVPGLVDPGFVLPGLLGFAFGVVPGLLGFGLSGLVVEGFVLPGVFGLLGLFGLFAPFGLLGFVLVGGFTLPVGGVPVFPVGGAEGEACPGVVPPAGACCATTQVPQNTTTAASKSFFGDIMRSPAFGFFCIPLPAWRKGLAQKVMICSLKAVRHCEYPADAVSGNKCSGSSRGKDCKPRKPLARYFLYCVGSGPFSSVSRSQIQPSRV